MSNIQKQHKISPAIAWLTIQKFIIFYCPLDGEHTNEYMYASIFINTTSKKTIQVGMQDFVGQYSVDWGLLMSAVVISLIPILIFFALVQKNLVQGLSAGAVKG